MSEANDRRYEDAVVIERMIAAPIVAVWDMWVDAQQFAAWYGPTGSTIHHSAFALEAGGKRLVGMTMITPNGQVDMWFTGEFLEIDPPNRLVYTEAIGDADGHVIDPSDIGMPEDTHPFTRVTVELEPAEGGNATRLRLTHAGIPADSPGAQGWEMALDKLHALLIEV